MTTFNAVRHAHVSAGGRVAAFGLGGLGHLAVQFASKMNYEVVAIARGRERESVARELGAHGYIDTSASDPGAALHKMGGADLIISTVPTTAPVAKLIKGLRVHGRLTLIGVDGGSVDLLSFVMNGQIVTGQLAGSALDTEEAMRFAIGNGVRPMLERMPLEQANEALDRISAGAPRFRIVLDTTPNG
ncbi:zinc-binding dehydrogenase [Georgenia sp. AZ-5]|uniref:zinc-binding dehydrogenase n=1 Tax=Georgenia sp. AZ-5 TaxID=3367526 RepID=UPI0037548DA6